MLLFYRFLSKKSAALNSHLGKLVGSASSDLGNTESTQLLLKLFQLRLKLTLALVTQLVRLELGCTTVKKVIKTCTR